MADETIQHDSVIGIDVHSGMVLCCAVWTEDAKIMKETAEFKTYRNPLRKMAEWCARHKPEVILMESTGIFWKSPFFRLEEAGLSAVVVNARHVKAMAGKKTDMNDAEWLAHVGRVGCFNRSFIPGAAYQALRMSERLVLRMTDDLCAYKNRVSKILNDAGFRLNLVFTDIFGVNARIAIKAIEEGKSAEEILQLVNTKRLKASPEELLMAFDGDLTPDHAAALESVETIIGSLETEIAKQRCHILRQVAALGCENKLLLLQSLPGVDEYAASMILVELGGGDLDTFGTGEKLASWLGICPGNNESAGKRHSGRIRKGNSYLRRILCECANAAVRTKNTTFQSKFRSLQVRKGRKRALIAIVNKMVHRIFVILKERIGYRDPNIDYDAMNVAKNGKRWIKALLKSEQWAIEAVNLETGECLKNI